MFYKGTSLRNISSKEKYVSEGRNQSVLNLKLIETNTVIIEHIYVAEN
jgi:hypothetical protein